MGTNVKVSTIALTVPKQNNLLINRNQMLKKLIFVISNLSRICLTINEIEVILIPYLIISCQMMKIHLTSLIVNLKIIPSINVEVIDLIG